MLDDFAAPSAPKGCLYRWVPGWGWGLFSKPIIQRPNTKAELDEDNRNQRGLGVGLAAPPRRIGPCAPNRWPAVPPGLRPYGLRPYEIKYQQAVASVIAAPRITESNRIRDLRDNIADEVRQRFEDERNIRRPHKRFKGHVWLLSLRFARGVRLAEIDGINALRAIKINGCYQPASEHAGGFIDATYSNDEASRDGSLTEVASTGFGYQDVADDVENVLGPVTIRGLEISPNRWDVYYKGRRILEGSPRPIIDARHVLQREGVNSGEVRRMIVLRERHRPGRKPLGDVAMTTVERVAKHRAAKTLPTQERNQPGAVAPLPLGPVAPGNPYDAEIERIMKAVFPEQEQAERYHQQLGDVLDRLKDAPPDYQITKAEFQVIALAASLRRVTERRELH
jgi:hypothetical protein